MICHKQLLKSVKIQSINAVSKLKPQQYKMKTVWLEIIAILFIIASSKRLLQVDPSQCATYDKTTKTCKSCYYHYWLNNGTCQAVDDKCATWDINTGVCTSCFYHNYLSQGHCYAVSDQCATWDPHTGWCTSCWSGGHLRDDGTCECCAWNGHN